MSHILVQTTNHVQKTMANDLKKTMMLRVAPRMLQDQANNRRLNKEDTGRSNLNRKYLSVTFVLKYPHFFYLFSLCSISTFVLKAQFLRNNDRPMSVS